jgi:hypothetical protein
LCLHQAIYPDKYLNAQTTSEDLVPFLNENGKGFWKSTDNWIRNYWNSGFAVPGAKQPQGDFQAIRAELKKYLSETYLWAANNTAPNLKNWPRNLSGSWALKGPSAAPVSRPVLQFSALTVQSGQARLVHRDVAVASAEVNSSPEEDDTTVNAAEVEEVTIKIHESLPAGALENLTVKEKPTYQYTWNAHVRVRK